MIVEMVSQVTDTPCQDIVTNRRIAPDFSEYLFPLDDLARSFGQTNQNIHDFRLHMISTTRARDPPFERAHVFVTELKYMTDLDASHDLQLAFSVG